MYLFFSIVSLYIHRQVQDNKHVTVTVDYTELDDERGDEDRSVSEG